MARRAVRDTYGLDPVSPDVFVRRRIAAGTVVPEDYTDFEDAGAVKDGKPEPTVGPADYVRETVQVQKPKAEPRRRARKGET
jgi:hypothetical protein